jgi:peroxiredoxin
MPLQSPGTMAPDFTLADVDGRPFTLSQQRGFVVALVLNRAFT